MEYNREIIDKRYIEVDLVEVAEEHERQMLLGVIIPSLLPLNIIKSEDHDLMHYNTVGYTSLIDYQINDIETLCKIIKGVIDAIIVSEQYLLMGAKHFLSSDMIFVEPESKKTRLIFGRKRNSGCFGDNKTIIEFLDNLKLGMKDRVFIQLIDCMIKVIKLRNPQLKRINIIVEEIEKKWYCRNLIKTMPFPGVGKNTYRM